MLGFATHFWFIYLARSANLRAIYFACINFFFLFFYLLDRFSRSFHQMEGICMNFLDHVQFSDSSRDVAMGTNFVSYRTCSLGAKVSQYQLDRFSQYLHHMVGIELQINNPTFVFRYLIGRCHGNQFSGKNGAKLPTPCTYYSVNPKRNGISQPHCICVNSANDASRPISYKNFVNCGPVTPEKTGLICILF